MPVLVSANGRRGVTWGRHGDPSRLRLKDATRPSETAPWTTTVHEFSASFEIEAVCSQSASALFLLGRNTSAGVVTHIVEKWTRVTGTDPVSSSPTCNMDRETIYRGTTLGELDLIGADPEGRFLMLYSRSAGELTQMFLPSEVTVVLSSSLPDITSLYRIDHVTQGRMWFFQTRAVDHTTTFIDRANDTNFETVSTLDYATWTALDYIGGYADNFIWQ